MGIPGPRSILGRDGYALYQVPSGVWYVQRGGYLKRVGMSRECVCLGMGGHVEGVGKFRGGGYVRYCKVMVLICPVPSVLYLYQISTITLQYLTK